ncbi:unnamed protein product, partial [Meganyctiphanes norvegica]
MGYSNSSYTQSYLYYGFYIYSLVLIAIAIGYTITGQGERIDIGWFLENVSPYYWAALGIGLVVSLSVVGAAMGIHTTGVSIIGGGVRAPRIKTKNLISVIFCEAVAIYGLIIAIILAGILEEYGDIQPGDEKYEQNLMSGYFLFGAGITVGFTNLFCGLAVGIVGHIRAASQITDHLLILKIFFGSSANFFLFFIMVVQVSKADFVSAS